LCVVLVSDQILGCRKRTIFNSRFPTRKRSFDWMVNSWSWSPKWRP